jgi:hypothetical protein
MDQSSSFGTGVGLKKALTTDPVMWW